MTKALAPPLAIASISLGLLIACILSTSDNKWYGLYHLLPISIVCSANSAFWEWRISKTEKDVSLALSPYLKWLVVIPSISLFCLLFVRLLFQEHFSSDPAALDFGYKHGDKDEPNLSFRGGSSWGHWIQGFVATFCAYASSSATKKMGLKLECAAYAGTIYIIYNFVKRMVRTPNTFATSSYMNNGCEWAIGAWVGIASGMLLMTLVRHRQTWKNESSDDNDEELQREEGESSTKNDSSTKCSAFASAMLFLFRTIAAVYCLSVVAASVMMGLTWNNCEKGGTNCGNYDAAGIPIGITVGLTLIPVVVAACGVVWGRFR